MLITRAMTMGLDTAHLIDIGDSLKASKEAFDAFRGLKARLMTLGFSIDIASAFRSFERQEMIFSGKFSLQRKVYDKNNNEIDLKPLSSLDRVKAICMFSSVPGFSRHHFGCDFDIYSKALLPQGQALKLASCEYFEGGYFYDMYLALVEHMQGYGFFMPYTGRSSVAFEPWHISHEESAQRYLDAFDFEYALSYIKNGAYPWSDAVCIYLHDNYRQMLGLK